MSAKKPAFPCRGFALFERAGAVDVRTVQVTGLFPLIDAAGVTETMTGVYHILPTNRVCSETTLLAKRAAYAAALISIF